jgi:hypothetical protein
MATLEVQFTDDQMEALRWLSSHEGKSVEELVRSGVDHVLRESSRDARIKQFLAAVGKYDSGLSDISENHDAYLADDFAG